VGFVSALHDVIPGAVPLKIMSSVVWGRSSRARSSVPSRPRLRIRYDGVVKR